MRELTPRQQQLHTIIFGTHTPGGKRFDVILICAILLSVFVVLLDSVTVVAERHHHWLFTIEWIFTILFTIEYFVRIYCSPARFKYMTSFFGIVDFLSILPSYLALFLAGSSYLAVVRLLRVLRIFRVLKLIRYLSDMNVLLRSLFNARRKILIFFFTVLILTTIFGAAMFLIEGPERGFTSIPKSIYWAIVTITTVGYGDISPQTPIGQILAAMVMLLGYSIIAVPTGILTAELAQEIQREKQSVVCHACGKAGHDMDAHFCSACGAELPAVPATE